MDKLKEKFKKGLKLAGSSAGISTKPAFQGTGHKLGSAEPKAPPPPRPSQPPENSHNAAPSIPPPPTTSSYPAAVVASTPAPAPPFVPPPSIDLPVEIEEALLSAADLLSSDPHCAAAVPLLSRLLQNITVNPSEEKYRKIRLSNPKIQAAVVDTQGGVELLLACGFQIVFIEKQQQQQQETNGNSGGGGDLVKSTENEQEEEEGFAVLDVHAELDPVHRALQILRGLVVSNTTTTATTTTTTTVQLPPQLPQQQQIKKQAREWDAPRPRNTHVILPSSTSSDSIPDWFFDRTGAEIKASFLAAVRSREQSQLLLTQATRERLRAQEAAKIRQALPQFATLKIRLPEGIFLQGEFDPGEPVATVSAWVADCLCDPMQTFDLMLPDRSVLQFNTRAPSPTPPSSLSSSGRIAAKKISSSSSSSGSSSTAPSSVKEAGLVPSVTLNLRWTGESIGAMKGVPALREELLRGATSG